MKSKGETLAETLFDSASRNRVNSMAKEGAVYTCDRCNRASFLKISEACPWCRIEDYEYQRKQLVERNNVELERRRSANLDARSWKERCDVAEAMIMMLLDKGGQT